MKRPTRRALLIGAAVALASGAACAGLPHRGKRTYSLSKPEEMERAITAAAPVGSPIATAEAFLRREGFRRGDRDDRATETWFYRDDGGFLALVVRNWRVRVDQRGGCVVGYGCFTGLTGL